VGGETNTDFAVRDKVKKNHNNSRTGWTDQLTIGSEMEGGPRTGKGCVTVLKVRKRAGGTPSHLHVLK